jgi:hypothetical protein
MTNTFHFPTYYDSLVEQNQQPYQSDYEEVKVLMKNLKQQFHINVLYVLIRYFNIQEYKNYTDLPFQCKKLKLSLKISYDLFPEKLQSLISLYLKNLPTN